MADITKSKDPVVWEEVEPIYVELAKRIQASDPKYAPLLLKKMFTLEVAKIVRELPAPAEEIAKKFNLKKEALEKTLHELVKKGYLVQTAKGPKLFSQAAQFNDILMSNPDYDKEHDEEFFKLVHEVLFGQAYCEQCVQMYDAYKSSTGRAMFRVIPRWKAIKDIPGVMPCEDMRELFRAYEGKLCNTRCICRTSSNIALGQQHFRKCAVHEGTIPSEGHCNHFGYIAEYYAEVMGFTPYLSVEQMLESLEALEKSRIYHMGPNRRDVNFICNCCECCHVAWPIRKLRGGSVDAMKDVVAPSRFLCTIDSGKCTGSKICVTKCPFDAIEIKNGKAHVDTEKCFGCGTCVINCPSEALKLKLVRPPEYIPEQGGPSVVEQIIFERV